MRFLITLFFLLLLKLSFAQNVLQGPVFGAVTDHSVRIYVRAIGDAEVTIELIDSAKNTITSTAQKRNFDNSIIIDFDNLQPNTWYNCKVYYDKKLAVVTSNFRSFPKEGEKGNYTFVTGSCQETDDLKVYEVMPLYEPYFMMHTGDYTYPYYEIGKNYCEDKEQVSLSYQQRYSQPKMDKMLLNTPIDYIYDDNDYAGGSAGRYVQNLIQQTKKNRLRNKEGLFIDKPLAEGCRDNLIQGYIDNFPSYDITNSKEGIYHSFKLGNAEFFVLDRSSARDQPSSAAFKKGKLGRRWKFNPPDDYCLFCPEQMEWLKRGLQESTADWKFIVSGVPLNKNMSKLIKAGQHLQKLHAKNYSGFHMMTIVSSYWAAFPNEQNDFLNFVEQNDIKNIIVISGETHHNVMDDGKNAGFPEINASGLSVKATDIGYKLKKIGKLTAQFNYKRKVWNQGGNGLGNKNFKSGFGKITIVEDQYVDLSIIDEDNNVVSSFKVPFK